MNALKQLPLWVGWRYTSTNGKLPINPKTGGNAQSNNPATWATYEQATTAAAKHHYDGIGFMLTDGICGIDIDKVDSPQREGIAQEIIALMNTYTERSPSGNGYHLIFKCDTQSIPQVNAKLDPTYYQKNSHSGVECYISGLTSRFFTYTGTALNDFAIEDRTNKLLFFLDNFMKKENPPSF